MNRLKRIRPGASDGGQLPGPYIPDIAHIENPPAEWGDLPNGNSLRFIFDQSFQEGNQGKEGFLPFKVSIKLQNRGYRFVVLYPPGQAFKFSLDFLGIHRILG